MKHNLLNGKTPLSDFASGSFWIIIKIVLLSVIVAVVIFSGGVYVWAQEYEGRLPPRTVIAGMDVGGMDPETVQQTFQESIDAILTNGIQIRVNGKTRTLSFVTRSSTEVIEDVDFKLDEAVEEMMDTHEENGFKDTLAMLRAVASPTQTTVAIILQQERIRQNILKLFPEAEVLSRNATFSIVWNGVDWTTTTQEGTHGTEFQWEPFFKELKDRLSILDGGPIELSLIDQAPRVSQEEAKNQIELAKAALAKAPYTLGYDGQSWSLDSYTLSTMLAPGEERQLDFLEKPYENWVSNIIHDVNQEARDARLKIENGRVVDFFESLEGRAVDEQRLKQDLREAINNASDGVIELVVNVEPPQVTTGDVNDLGIDEILGTGTSSYRGSPTNRRDNIQNGVDLLNGILIAPGETFSLLKALSPFTYENGYLSELVIKGDKIEPEIGGGLCQIGTTTFRAAMNSGLPIIERQNHSLVVSYYNDPSNGNPGTDATIYDPAPDFKFTNDTDNYILFQAENLTESQELRFTFWGTNDGRVASYSPPVVSRWIPVGETRYIETLDLEPGEEQCQSSHIGADASFTYTVVRPTGDVEETVYESHYRPLPRICLVGVKKLSNGNEQTNGGDNEKTDMDNKQEEKQAQTTTDANE